MTTTIALPIIKTDNDLAEALARLDVIIDAPDDSIEADERTGPDCDEVHENMGEGSI